ncbi:MAG: T9SS type A sorting domain-containing protein, partial [Bacteroidales bacterium]|nr:T9SS type A sorting domain-containing protein [Bacteroidales bacterium]
GPFSQSVSNMETKLKSTEDTTSIINYSNVNIKIYPIPATNELNIEFNELNYDLVEIINLNGEVIFMTKEYSDKLSINTSYIPDGMYILRIYHSEGIISRKIAINKH